MPCVVIVIPKDSFCNTVRACMVMQMKLVAAVFVLALSRFYTCPDMWLLLIQISSMLCK